MIDYHEIEQAITTLEAQVDTLGQDVVELSVAALRRHENSPESPKISDAALKGERRQVTVMFADISGFTAMSEKLDPEEVRGMINACFDLLGSVIDRYGGHIDKFIGDEIMALFGAPIAHENDPERALRAALDMMAVLEDFNHQYAGKIPKPLALHFGINSGLVIAGGIGTRQRQDYSVMGDTVNLAARLEDLSEAGEILVGQATYRQTAPFFEFDPLEPVKVKGKAEPVRVYRLLKAKAVPGGQLRGIEGLHSPMVGRTKEWVLLKEILARFFAGRGGVVSVIGEAGLGKSRLIEELAAACAEDEPVQWVEGRALSYGENASYLVVRDMLRNLLGLSSDTPPAQAEALLRATVERRFAEHSARVYPFLAHLLELPLDETSAQQIKVMEGEALHRQIIQAVTRFLVAMSEQVPLVLTLEDLHWADPSSLRLLEALVPFAQDSALLIFLVYRRSVRGQRLWMSPEYDSTGGKAHPIIELEPLSAEESGQLLDNLLGRSTLPENIRRLMVAKAEGNPFYLEEVIRSLINRGAIMRSNAGQWQVTAGLKEIKLPDTLQGVITSRVDQLSMEAKRVMQIASVIGREFSPDLLAEVLERV